MPVTRPHPRTYRPFTDGDYTEGGRARYVLHPSYAQSPSHYVRAFLLLLKDLQELFDYVEPADTNLRCYSHRIHTLLFRACVEFEANCSAILIENGYSKQGSDLRMTDYKKINSTHRLSSYQVIFPHWTGTASTRTPLLAWATGETPAWWRAYNRSKHNRHAAFSEATFEQVVDACAAVLAVLSAQFGTHDYSPGETLLAVSMGPGDGTESGIGGYLRVRFPSDWALEDRYEFEWPKLAPEAQPFRSIDYSKIA